MLQLTDLADKKWITSENFRTNVTKCGASTAEELAVSGPMTTSLQGPFSKSLIRQSFPQSKYAPTATRRFPVMRNILRHFWARFSVDRLTLNHRILRLRARIFKRNNGLRKRIDPHRRDYTTLGGEQKTIWYPEIARVRNIIVKNARGHVYYELGQPAFAEPSSVGIHPLEMHSRDDLSGFLAIVYGDGWPEVGSRTMTRLITGQDMEDGWIVVQDGSVPLRGGRE